MTADQIYLFWASLRDATNDELFEMYEQETSTFKMKVILDIITARRVRNAA
jgi:hypothetical protein